MKRFCIVYTVSDEKRMANGCRDSGQALGTYPRIRGNEVAA